MADKFPIIPTTKGALFGPLGHMPGLIRTYAIMGLAFAVVYLYAVYNGLSMDVVQSMMDPAEAENMDPQYAFALLQTILLAGLLIGGASAYVFNYWVRFGASGETGVAFGSNGDAISAMLLNMVKFFFIFLLIGVASIVLVAVLAMVGVGPDEAEQNAALAAGDLQTMTASGLVTSLLSMVVVCTIYSWFSANLTQTALKSKDEGLEHPHTIDFAVVIFLVYMVVFVPSTLAGLTGSWTLSIIVQALVGTYVAFAIAVAHGIRYSICVGERHVEGTFS